MLPSMTLLFLVQPLSKLLSSVLLKSPPKMICSSFIAYRSIHFLTSQKSLPFAYCILCVISPCISTFINIILLFSDLCMPRMLMCFFSRIAVPLLCYALQFMKAFSSHSFHNFSANSLVQLVSCILHTSFFY